ncbi:MAG TPA: efflux RND transporter periplasmic adaptor subunit [Candidatus Binatia bacterium]|jgi:RND family efflux transporter MFP subunit|nr:efflux RND transporter periplasmic adaptor subunit [Candidatus Binatia bacterium]
MPMRRRWIGLLGMALIGCHHDQTYERQAVPVQIQPVLTQDTAAGLGYSASIVPYTQVALDAKVGGYVRQVLQVKGADGRMRDVQDGDAVTKGTVLALIDDRQYRDQLRGAVAQLAEARAALVETSAKWQRSTALWATQSITAPDHDNARKEHDTATAKVQAAQAQVAADQLDVGWTRIVMPEDGVVLQRNIDVGSLTQPGTVLFQMADTAQVKAVFGVPDVGLGTAPLGSTQTVLCDAYPGEPFTGRVTEVSAAADTQTRVFSVEITIPNDDGRLRAGMIASLRVGAGSTPSVPVVPLAAVVRDPAPGGGFAVFVVDTANGASVAKVRPVTLGTVYGNVVAVPAGLKPGDGVVVRGATLLADGSPVAVVP